MMDVVAFGRDPARPGAGDFFFFGGFAVTLAELATLYIYRYVTVCVYRYMYIDICTCIYIYMYLCYITPSGGSYQIGTMYVNKYAIAQTTPEK